MFVLSSLFVGTCLAASARIGVLVVDEADNRPVANVRIVANFQNRGLLSKWGTSSSGIESALTDVRGRCTFKGSTDQGKVGVHVKYPAPAGYYLPQEGVGYEFKSKNLLGTWQPDNLVATIRLQRVEHPLPLFVKQVTHRCEKGFLGTDVFMSFDLLKADWLPPYGQGAVADVTIRSKVVNHEPLKWPGGVYDNRTVPIYDVVNEMAFPGRGNGCSVCYPEPTCGVKIRVVKSDFKNECCGYKFGRDKKRMPKSGDWYPQMYSEFDRRRCYVFRVRSKYDEQGRLVDGYYGKIYGDFNFDGTEKGLKSISFRYYLNQKSLDTNLEWDCRSNRCSRPGDLYEPLEP